MKLESMNYVTDTAKRTVVELTWQDEFESFAGSFTFSVGGPPT